MSVVPPHSLAEVMLQIIKWGSLILSDARTGMRFLLTCLCGWIKGMFQGQQLESLKGGGSPACMPGF